MKVSVVIPVFNEEKYIEQCLLSLQNQDIKPDEIIVIDNNCTDKTIEIVKKFKVKIIKENRQGMIYARNKGFDTASSEIIARCDADAILPPDWIKRIKNNFKDKNIDALSGLVRFYDFGFETNFFVKVYLKLIMLILKRKGLLMGPNMILRKNIWNKIKDKVCINDKEVHEDIDLTIHIMKEGGKIKNDNNLKIKVSARRIKNNPFSFFIEYPIRLIKTFLKHK